MKNNVEKFLEYSSVDKIDTNVKLCNTSLDELVATVKRKQDCILFGPPGTSKTYYVNNLKEKLGDTLGKMQIIQFHANYSYEEFIDGIVPDVENGGFKYQTGIFFDFCEDAKRSENMGKICPFIIDEINRANITAVFGEVMNLMENKGKRKTFTAKQRKEFSIPENVVIIGTMNTADKTLAKLDFAFRRRFRFLPVYPSKEILHKMVAANGFNQDIPLSIDEYTDCFEILNAKIRKSNQLGKEMTIGHVLWTRKDNSNSQYTSNDIASIFRESVFPQLESYCGNNKELLGSLLGTYIRDKLIYGYYISDADVIDFLVGLKNSKAGEK